MVIYVLSQFPENLGDLLVYATVLYGLYFSYILRLSHSLTIVTRRQDNHKWISWKKNYNFTVYLIDIQIIVIIKFKTQI